nr:peptidoglycan endopeptidase [Oxalobacteraceae bacterium]
RVGEQIDKKDLQPGDLVFFNTLRRTFSHVGIYLGDNKFIHAPTPGSAVRVESMDLSYWKARFNGARRVLDTENNEPGRR